MKLNSHNEWAPLKTVVVGTVEGFRPGLEISDNRPGLMEAAQEIVMKAYPRWYLDEVAEDLDDLCNIFRRAGVRVLRPEWTEASSHFETPNWAASGFDIYNVRDLHIVFGNTLVSSASSARFRLFETFAFRELLYEHFFDDGFKWISAPLPRLRGEYVHEITAPRNDLESAEDTQHHRLSHGLSEVYHRLDEHEVIFDSANIIRLGRDILFLVSNTGNHKAVKWLQNVLGPEYRVHVTQAYRSSHLDSTILPLHEGAVLLNGVRVDQASCPEVFETWDKVYFTDVVPLPKAEVDFHTSVRLPVHHQLKAMGVASKLSHISSPWVGLNVLSIDPRTVLVHDEQKALIRLLEARGLTVIPVRMRHCYSMLGGLHCTTLDLVRESTL